jgi:quinohemoprotein ethanol dehydrogenase
MSWFSRGQVVGASITPDLRRVDPAVRARIRNIVLDGERAPNGMGRFDDVVDESGLTAISDYLLDQSWQLYRDESAAPPH